MPAPILDKGHAGSTLDTFVALPVARAAHLERAHVLAIRLYSCSVYRNIVGPLRRGCSVEAPHPYPYTVSSLNTYRLTLNTYPYPYTVSSLNTER